jgi:hypothetical protein
LGFGVGGEVAGGEPLAIFQRETQTVLQVDLPWRDGGPPIIVIQVAPPLAGHP